MVHEPRRLWRRYFFGNATFVRGLVSDGTLVEWRASGAGEGETDDRPRVTVLMASFNRRLRTLRCLESLFRQHQRVRLRVVLVDDASSDGTAEAVALAYPEVTVIPGSGSLYWAGAMRLAFERARDMPFDYVLWLNDDVSLADGALDALITTERQLRADRGPVIVVGALRDPATGVTSYSGVRRRGLKRTAFHQVRPGSSPRRAETMNGNVVLVPKEVAGRVGNLDGAYQHGMADYDYGLRAGAAGVEIWVAPGIVGECSRDQRPRNVGSLKERWRTVTSAKGIPPRDWLVFTRRHAGPLWALYWLRPYLRVIGPGLRPSRHSP